MDAELKECFSRLEGKIDGLTQRFDRLEQSHAADHDKLIRLEGCQLALEKELHEHEESEKEYGEKTDARIKDLDGKLIKYGIVIAIIASSIGGGTGELIRKIMGG